MIEQTQDTIGYLSQTEGMVTNRTRFKILQAVSAIHILAVTMPFVWQLVWSMVKPPPPKIMNVRMITQLPDTYSAHSSSAPGGYAPPAGGGGAPAPPSVIPSQPTVTPRQPNIRPVPLAPPQVTPTQPRVTPSPPPVRVAARGPAPKKTQTVRPPQVVNRNQERNQPKNQTRNQAGNQPDKDFKPISQQDWQGMNQPPPTANTSTGAGTSGTGTGSGSPGAGSGTGTGRSTGPIGPPGDGLPGDKFALDFSQYVAHYLKENWDTPSRIQLGGREPEVTVRLRFAPSGQIVSWEMVKPSGIAIMDTSVEKLMRFVKRIPQPPPKNVTELTLILAISD